LLTVLLFLWPSASFGFGSLRVLFLSIAMARPRIRSSSQLHVYSPWTNLGWRVTRTIDIGEGEAKVRCGHFRHVHDENGKVVGYQPVIEVQVSSSSTPSDPSRAALGRGEMRAAAGLMGSSRTAHLGELDKLSRVDERTGKPLPPEDFVERVQALMDAYPASANFRDIRLKRRGLAPGGDRAVRVYPRMVETAACQR
jgi:hypothetical protein